MSESMIPDPTDPTGPVITSSGDLASPVFFAPVGTEPDLTLPEWKHLGWLAAPFLSQLDTDDDAPEGV